MVYYGLFLSFLLGILINSTFSSLSKTATEIKDPFIPFDQQHFIPSVENIVDSRFKVLAANFQDQINDLKGKVSTLDVTKTANKELFESQHQHEIQKRETNAKRPFCEYSGSLCTFFYPDHPDAGNKKGKYKPTVTNGMPQADPTEVKGVPSSCKDLQLLGHKLNGFYLIKTSQPNEATKIGTVFCDFQSPTATNVSQDLIGNIDMKTKSVHFYVKRKISLFVRGHIPFDLARLNEGEAFNLKSGIFTAPVAGIYHFYFATSKHSSSHQLYVVLRVNSVNVGCAHNNQGVTGNMTVLGASLSSFLRLKKNDAVSLHLKEGGISDYGSYITHFTGWLVEEDLIKI